MSQRLITIVALICFAGTAQMGFAQLSIGPRKGFQQTVYMGGRVELNMTKVKYIYEGGEKQSGGQYSNGVNISLPFECQRTSLIAIQPELVFSRKTIIRSQGSPEKTILNYLELPVLVKFGFGQKGFRLNVYSGASIGLRVNRKKPKINTNTRGLLRSDAGFVFGVEPQIEFLNGRIIIDVRYHLGLLSYLSNIDVKMYNRGLSFGLGYAHLIHHIRSPNFY